jgi:hypothetical protein
MRARIPDSLLGKLVFLSGLVWMLFGVALFLAFASSMFGARSQPFPGLALPFFGLVSITMDFTVTWIHVIGFLLMPLFCIATGLAICVLIAPKFSLCKRPV